MSHKFRAFSPSIFFLPFRFVFNFVLLYFRCYFLWDNYFSSSKFFFLHYDCANLFSKLNDFGSSWSLNQIVIARSCFSLSPKLILRCLMWQVSDDSIGFFMCFSGRKKMLKTFLQLVPANWLKSLFKIGGIKSATVLQVQTEKEKNFRSEKFTRKKRSDKAINFLH